MASRSPSPSLRVVSLRGKGRGIVAARPFSEGEVVERDPVIVIPSEDWPRIRRTIISKYCFIWHEGRDEGAVPLGHGSLLNHSYTPNVIARLRLRQRAIDFLALRDIDEGEELTLNYNGEPDDSGPVGFDVRR